MQNIDEVFIEHTFKLALQGRGRTSPNPIGGAVVVKDDKIIGEGFHSEVNKPHAVIYALEAAGENAKDATLYLTIEPCIQNNNKSFCIDKIIQSGIKRVVIAMKDPNPINSGKGISILRENGIDVTSGVLENKAKKLNEIFIKYILTKKPFVTMVTSMSLDGKIATTIGDSHWISSEASRDYVHSLRSYYDAIMVGVNTVFQDNPSLECKHKGAKQPLKIIIDSQARIPLDSKVFNNSNYANRSNVIIAVSKYASKERVKCLQQKGAEVIVINIEEESEESNEITQEPFINLKKLMSILGKRGITSILLEGGGTLNASAIKSGIVDKLVFFIAPKIIGGVNAPTPVEGEGVYLMTGAYPIYNWEWTKLGDDMMVQGYFYDNGIL